MTFKQAMMVVVGIVLVSLAGCTAPTKGKDHQMRYAVHRVAEPITIDANWDKPPWRKIEPLELANYMGQRPRHFPRTQAKLAYDDQGIYVIFRVEDRYIRAVARQHQDMVCRDSCVEFFFAPHTDLAKGYFNLEMNCGGTMLLNYQVIPRQNMIPLSASILERIEVAHTLPKIVDPEIAEPTTWTVEYRLPVDFLGQCHPSPVKPAPGVSWRTNFFKCADETSQPHWLTWARVDRPKPDFHVPEYFGTLEFK